jgi:hypothetical protein
MNQPLFINTNQDFISRIRTEGGPVALVTSSMIQALRWISNPDVALSGIYLNPNDATYSALRFIELSLLQRPATPVFLIDAENEISPQTSDQVLNLNHVRGTFKEHETFETFIEPLNLNTPVSLQKLQKRIIARSEHAGYIAVPIVDFVNAKTYPFDVFVEGEGKQLRLFASAGALLEPEYLSHVSTSASWLFVNEQTIQQVRENLRITQHSYMNIEAFPVSWKTTETLFNARTLLNEMRKAGLSDGLLEHTHFLLSDVFQLVSQLSQTSRLAKFVNQAKECDRTMACATLSILMCKTLRFEKNAIVEILGLASFFQDVALYNSPFGNLCEQRIEDYSADAYAYFLKHPVLSADLVAQSTSIPDVTLQVMRQHHERKDRTGFPNRIGGMQLHPMAEVLSLINAYLDHSGPIEALETDVFTHYSDRIVGAFRELLGKLETQKNEEMKAMAA